MPHPYRRKVYIKLPWRRLPPDVVKWIVKRASEWKGLSPVWNYFEISRSLKATKRIILPRNGIKWVVAKNAPELLAKRAQAFKDKARRFAAKACPECRRPYTKKWGVPLSVEEFRKLTGDVCGAEAVEAAPVRVSATG